MNWIIYLKIRIICRLTPSEEQPTKEMKQKMKSVSKEPFNLVEQLIFKERDEQLKTNLQFSPSSLLLTDVYLFYGRRNDILPYLSVLVMKECFHNVYITCPTFANNISIYLLLNLIKVAFKIFRKGGVQLVIWEINENTQSSLKGIQPLYLTCVIIG